jgi:hypothetical protein
MKSTLFDINIAILACFGGHWLVNLLQPFFINQCLFLSIRWVSCK